MAKEKKIKKGRTVYLPPSFMEAQLLTGFDASTFGRGTNNPEPLLLRIQTPAVLPNDIKANLSGCFVISCRQAGQGTG
jgi:conjugal transfer pilus assembly protein TraB